MPGFPECAVCNELVTETDFYETETDFYETKLNVRLLDGSEVKGRVPTHQEHGVEEHIAAVSQFLRPYLIMSSREPKPEDRSKSEFKPDKPSSGTGASLKAHGVRPK